MSLLQVIKLTSDKIKGAPLFLEIPVHAETAPYLVSSHKGLIWISTAHQGVVRSAMIRGPWKIDLRKVFEDAVSSTLLQGRELRWGNGFPSTREGRDAAIAYLKEYGFEDVEVLIRDAKSSKDVWEPGMDAVVVPTDRSYLGTVGVWDDNTYTVVVHNPARGLAVMGDWNLPHGSPERKGTDAPEVSGHHP